MTFGVFAVATGFSVAQAQVMSLLVFTGGSQFAAVGVISSGGTSAAAFASAGLLAARNGMYGLVLNPIVRGGWARRLVAAHVVLDESTAMATAQRDPAEAEKAFWFTGVAVFVLWNLGTLLGAVGGNAIGDPETYGLDAAFPAGFVALMAPHLRKKPGLIAAVAGGFIAFVEHPPPPRRRPHPARHPRRPPRPLVPPPRATDVSWTAIILLGALSYGLKATGLLVLDHIRVPRTFTEVTALLPPALLAALVVVQTFADGTTLVLDARAAGLLAGIVAVALRAPFLVVVVSAAGVTAAVRALA